MRIVRWTLFEWFKWVSLVWFCPNDFSFTVFLSLKKICCGYFKPAGESALGVHTLDSRLYATVDYILDSKYK